ncbi:probable serine/threonine-protein kinase DDB_G0282963 isoform X1 [Lucilia cuprina]|uniref:probable serine/threonine-protein kinase DDB_G0282963 isoform X1 n=1 Tax=Lucilia cuprina TaxID=7375 RepID=UPI001F05FC0A|nr:probable serine/threonine-protein kinase DDB_G0282963 isoform X1 [Lucilia cuprina]XP_046801575.1 probable serine/threonine-protein kinase DDB_G0282963 isoform X1 [Lucilia cuprina]XP_046801577.1 probable serine/threonine-protein kinase DDB_G0282963 isoform X1 [Lucilia cuprina]XP_046801578.1 probable serine/threonine-protein kinase DDB_G0282963 isoform X1 [Lucilia cuprina]
MVSTTLTTIAAGKTTSGINNLHSSTATSSTSPENYTTIETTNRAHYQPRSNSSSSSSQHQQQHVSSSLASPTATATTQNNSFYYSRGAHTNEVKTAINGNDNLNDSTEFNHNAKYYQREQIQQQQQQQLLREQQQQKYFNGKTTNGETTKHETTTTSATTTAVNLSQALLSPSPPIKDQISLLFPKCRPKTANNNSSLESSPTDGNSNVTREDLTIRSNSNLKLNHKQQNGEIENQDLQQQNKLNTNNHYYRSVNIITQSPPPHSVSSISSESLSSVTPRISTNPFLCSTLLATEETEENNKRRDLKHQPTSEDSRKVTEPGTEEEELPVPNYAPFYYHTSNTTTSPPTKDLRKHNEDLRERSTITTSPPAKELLRKHNEEQRERQINEMPRKRSQYERYHHIQAVNGQNYSREEKPYNHLNHAEILNAVQQHQRNVEHQQQQQQHHHSQQNGHQSSNQNPFVKDNYWETRQNTTPTSTVLNSPDYSGNNGSIEIETRSHNRRSIYQQQQQHQQQPTPELHLSQQQSQQQSAYIGRQQPPVTSHHIRLGRSPNSDATYQDTNTTTNNTTAANTTQKRNNYNAQQQQQQHNPQKSNPCSEGLTPLAAQYLYGSKTSLQESSLNHQNDWPEKRDMLHDRSERCLARERDRERELREQRSKTINVERERDRYINAALVRESVGEQTTNNAIEIRDRRERHSYSAQQQQQHHNLAQKYQQQHKSGQQYQHHSTKSHQQQHNQSQRQLNDERLGGNNDVIYDDMAESWQNLRVTTDSSSQINNTRSLVSDTAKSHIDTSSTSSAVNSVSKKSHLLSDIKDDKHIVTVGSNCDVDTTTSSYKEHHNKYLEKSHTINVETRHGIIEYEGSPRRIGQMGNTNDVEHIPRVNNKLSQNLTATTAVTATKSNHHNAIAMTTAVAATTATNATTNSPKQHYAARPGFPQRIISPQRESTPPIMMLNYNSKQQQQQLQQHSQQQQLNSQTLPQQSPNTDNNAEDTSNDVSEIGTISDLTTPEAISTANNLLVGSSGVGCAASVSIGGSGAERPPTPPPIDKDLEIIGVERGTATTTSSLTTSCTTPTTTAAIAAVVAAATANSSATTATANNTTTMTHLNMANASMTAATMMNSSSNPLSIPTKSSTFDYLYEFSETRKVLEEFFKCPSNDDKPIIENSSDVDSIDIQYEFHTNLGRDIEEDEADGDAEVEDDEDDIQLDVENEDEEEDEDEDNNDETPQHHQHSQQQQMQQQHYHQQQHHTPLQTTNSHHNQHHSHQQNSHHQQQQQHQHHVNYRNHLQSPTQFSYRPYNENGDGEDDIDDVDINHDILDINEHDDSKLHHHQQDIDGEGGGSGSIIGIDEHNHHNFSLMNNRHNSRHHNARRHFTGSPLMRDFDFFLDSASRSSCEQIDQQIDGINHNQMNTNSRQNYRYSPETTDYDSNCGDLDSLSGELNGGVSTSCSNYAAKFYAASAMPILEDGLSSGHTSDTENNNQNNLLNQQNSTIHHTPIGGGISMLMDMKRVSTNNSINSMNNLTITAAEMGGVEKLSTLSNNIMHETSAYMRKNDSPINGLIEDSGRDSARSKPEMRDSRERELIGQSPQSAISNNKVFKNIDPDLDSLYSISVFHRNDMVQMTPPPPAPAPHRKPNVLSAEPDILQPTPYRDMTRTGTNNSNSPSKVNTTTTLTSTSNSSSSGLQTNTSPKQAQTIKRTAQPPPLPERNVQRSPSPVMNSPVWLSRHLDVSASNKGLLESSSENHSKNLSADEDDVDTDLETDRLLGHQRLDDQGYYDENKSWDRKPARSLLSKISPKQVPSTKTRNGYNALLSSTPEIPPPIPPKNSSNKLLDIGGSLSSSEHSDKSPIKSIDIQDCGLTLGSPGGSEGSGCLKKEIDNGLGATSGNSSTASGNGVNSATGNTGGNGSSIGSGSGSTTGEKKVKKSKNKEGGAVLIEGVLFRAKYLGSTQLVCEGQPTKSTRMMQAEEAVSRIKALAPDGDVQPSTEVDLFISTEKIMVLNTDLKEIMMDHALRTISYIADIGDLVVLMARRRFVPQDIDDAPKPNRTPKMICHVFESDEAQFIAQSIGQAFQVAYMEFLKANGIEDHRFVKEMDYQEVLNSQEIFGDELEIFAKKELQKEVVVPKAKGEILGVVIVESGWGSMLPTVVIANLMSTGAAARCGQLNIGDQLIAINGLSLVGLPLSTCQTYIKNTKNQTVVKFTVVPCPPVVEVKIKRPETKYQLGFSVQNGVICSLLRGGIAERGGVRVGHRIIEINNQSVVAVPHEKIVNLLATSVGEILMKTMPTSMFRLLTGQENPIYI